MGVMGLCCTLWKLITCDITFIPPATLKALLWRLFVNILVLERYYRVLVNPCLYIFPRTMVTFSAGWKCFQKLLISPLGWVERTQWRERLPRSSSSLSTKIRDRNKVSCLAMYSNKHKAITEQGFVKMKGWGTWNGKAMLLSKYW